LNEGRGATIGASSIESAFLEGDSVNSTFCDEERFCAVCIVGKEDMGGLDTCLTWGVEILWSLVSEGSGCEIEKSVLIFKGDNESACVSTTRSIVEASRVKVPTTDIMICCAVLFDLLELFMC
jgi:hypothetical protein